MRRPVNAERADHRARGLAARDHQPAHALLHQALGDRRHGVLDRGAGALAAEPLVHLGDLFGRRRRADQDRPVAQMLLGERQRPRDVIAAVGEPDRVEHEGRPAGGTVARDLTERRGRAAAGEDRLEPGRGGQAVGASAGREQAGAPEVLGQAHGDARAAGDQGKVGRRGAERHKMSIADRIGDRLPDPLAAQLVEARADRLRARARPPGTAPARPAPCSAAAAPGPDCCRSSG